MESTAASSHRHEPVDVVRPQVQRVLDEFLDHQRALLGDISPDVLPLLDAAVALLRGGKRLRATFCYWGWRAAGGDPSDEAVVRAAAALELFQASALIHDDLIDGSDIRRGNPSIHRQFATQHRTAGWRGQPDNFGAAAAILLGDLLLTWSDELFNTAHLANTVRRHSRAVLERMRTEVASGQYLDILEQVSGDERPTGQADRARTVIRYKSARYSVEHPLVIGGSLADAPAHLLAVYRDYGSALGEAFQLRDDILGVFGDPAHTGKPIGDDLREGKRTVLVAFAVERANPAQATLISHHLGDPTLDLSGVEALRQVFVDTGALARVETRVSDLVAQAWLALKTADVTPEGHHALAQLIELATIRIR